MKKMMRKKKITNLVYDKLIIPFVEFELADGAKGRAIVDTGSESSMFDINFVKEHKKCFEIKKIGQNMDMFGLMASKKNSNMIMLSCPLYFKNEEGSFEVNIQNAILSDLSFVNNSIKDVHGKENMVQALFGSDWMRDKHVKINFKTEKLEF